MNVQEILSQLDRNEGRFPQAAVRESIARREEIDEAHPWVANRFDGKMTS